MRTNSCAFSGESSGMLYLRAAAHARARNQPANQQPTTQSTTERRNQQPTTQSTERRNQQPTTQSATDTQSGARTAQSWGCPPCRLTA
eukprot:7148289-Prymnesium_polylepis.1